MCTLDHSTATIQWKNGITPLVTPQSVFTVFTVGMTVLVILNLRTIVFMKSAKTMEKKKILSRSRLSNVVLFTCSWNSLLLLLHIFERVKGLIL